MRIKDIGTKGNNEEQSCACHPSALFILISSGTNLQSAFFPTECRMDISLKKKIKIFKVLF